MNLNKKLNTFKVKLFAGFVFCNLLFYGIFSINHFASDTFVTEMHGYEAIMQTYWRGGRWLMSLFLAICNAFKLSFTFEKLISWGLAIICLSTSAMVVYEILLNRRKSLEDTLLKKTCTIICSFLLITNVFTIEYFIFTEYTGIMCLGILLSVISAKYILQFLAMNEGKRYFIGIGLAILSIMCHQGTFAIGVVIMVICAEHTFRDVKAFMKNNIIIGSAYIIPGIVNLLQVRLIGNSRLPQGQFDFIESLYKATQGVKLLLLTSANYLPQYVYICAVLVIALFLAVCIIKSRRIKAYISVLYYIVIVTLGIYTPLMLTDINFIDVVPRTVYVMGALVPIILMIICVNYEEALEKNWFIILYLAIFMMAQLGGAFRISSSHYGANRVDEYEAKYVGGKIWEYEQATGTTINKIAVYHDLQVRGVAPGITSFGAVNARAFCIDWAVPFAIQRLDGKALTPVEKSDEVFAEFFQEKDWYTLDEEQLVFIGDTLHFCMY